MFNTWNEQEFQAAQLTVLSNSKSPEEGGVSVELRASVGGQSAQMYFRSRQNAAEFLEWLIIAAGEARHFLLQEQEKLEGMSHP